jgi:hypothetical protein
MSWDLLLSKYIDVLLKLCQECTIYILW